MTTVMCVLLTGRLVQSDHWWAKHFGCLYTEGFLSAVVRHQQSYATAVISNDQTMCLLLVGRLFRVTIGGRYTFGCIKMKDFLTALGRHELLQAIASSTDQSVCILLTGRLVQSDNRWAHFWMYEHEGFPDSS